MLQPRFSFVLAWFISRASCFGIGGNQPRALVTADRLLGHLPTPLYNSQFSSWGDDYIPEELESSAFDIAKEIETDWWQAELTLLNAPSKPDPDLSAESVAITCIRSLQWVDYPKPADGLRRCYEFLTYGCREIVTARRGGGKSVDKFVEHGLYAPALQPFMGASRVEIGDCTYTPAKAPYRGALASFPVTITGAAVLSLQHPSGMDRDGITTEPPVTNMVVRLEQLRRPPNQGCWMVYEIMDVRHAFAGDMGNAHVGG